MQMVIAHLVFTTTVAFPLHISQHPVLLNLVTFTSAAAVATAIALLPVLLLSEMLLRRLQQQPLRRDPR